MSVFLYIRKREMFKINNFTIWYLNYNKYNIHIQLKFYVTLRIREHSTFHVNTQVNLIQF